MLLGAGLALFGFAMDTSVHSVGTYIGSYIGGGDTYNLGLLQRQMMVFQAGLALFVAGAIFGSGERATNPATTAPEQEEPETDEERDAREALDRRRLLITFAVLGAAAIAALLLLLSDSGTSSYGPMNVDESLTTTDLNVLDENLAGRAAK